MDNVINVTHPDILRQAGQHQTDVGLLWLAPRMRTWGNLVLGSDIQIGGGRIHTFNLSNRSAGAAAIGIGFRWQNKFWQAGSLTAADVYARDANLQDNVAVTIGVLGANQDAFCVMSNRKFSWVSANFTTAETDNDAGGEITHTVQYSNAAGAGWTNVAAASTYIDEYTLGAGNEWTIAPRNFVWEPPTDWGLSNGLSATIPDGMYVLAFRTAGREALDVAPIVTGVEIGSLLAVDQVAANGNFNGSDLQYDDMYGDGLVAFFSVADAGNRVYAEVYAIG